MKTSRKRNFTSSEVDASEVSEVDASEVSAVDASILSETPISEAPKKTRTRRQFRTQNGDVKEYADPIIKGIQIATACVSIATNDFEKVEVIRRCAETSIKLLNQQPKKCPSVLLPFKENFREIINICNKFEKIPPRYMVTQSNSECKNYQPNSEIRQPNCECEVRQPNCEIRQPNCGIRQPNHEYMATQSNHECEVCQPNSEIRRIYDPVDYLNKDDYIVIFAQFGILQTSLYL
jgi:hypothetical protein